MTNTAARDADRIARALGWTSVGLGLPQLFRPAAVTRAIGVGQGAKQQAVTKAVGMREMLHAVGLLHPRIGARWIWTRVVGDAMDLVALSRAMRRHDGDGRGRTIAATAGVVGISAVDVYAALLHARAPQRTSTVDLTATTTVGKDPQETYAFWRRLDNLPEFMAHVEEVRRVSDTRSHWRVTAPFGRTVEWDAEITDDVPGERLAWRSAEGSQVANHGVVRFTQAPRGQGTEVHVTMSYDIPGGKLGEALARWAGEEPHQQLDDDLRRFKQVMETGEVVRSDGAPWGKRARREFPQHAAQPLSDNEIIDLTREEVRV
ncbi:MAG: Cyclase [Frankiales bacterium]|nr:Cyclase [Frankiales bacterium]